MKEGVYTSNLPTRRDSTSFIPTSLFPSPKPILEEVGPASIPRGRDLGRWGIGRLDVRQKLPVPAATGKLAIGTGTVNPEAPKWPNLPGDRQVSDSTCHTINHRGQGARRTMLAHAHIQAPLRRRNWFFREPQSRKSSIVPRDSLCAHSMS